MATRAPYQFPRPSSLDKLGMRRLRMRKFFERLVLLEIGEDLLKFYSSS